MKLTLHPALSQLSLITHFMLILCIASLLMFNYQLAAGFLIDINIMCVGFYWLFSIQNKTKCISNTAFTLLAIIFLALQLPNLNYTSLLHINNCILILYLAYLLWVKDNTSLKVIGCIFAMPIFFTLLDMLSNQSIALSLFARNTWNAAYITAAIWVIAKRNAHWISKYGAKLIGIALFIYALLLVQMPISASATFKPIYLLGGLIDDTPHIMTAHLSLFACCAFFAALYCLLKSFWPAKIIWLPILVGLLLFILYTAWRPIWLGMMAGGFISVMLCYKHKRKIIITSLIILHIVLLISNFGHFRDRLVNLVGDKKPEERTIIWQDAWTMQRHSSPTKWVTGHGLMQFKEDFKLYSQFHLNPTSIPMPTAASQRLWVFNPTIHRYLSYFKIYTAYSIPNKSETYLRQAVDYSSPHNLLLDVLYTSGIAGVIFISCFYFYLIRHIVRLSAFSAKNRLLACIALSALICNLIANGLNFPFFMSFNIYPLAFICGVILYLHENQHQTRLSASIS